MAAVWLPNSDSSYYAPLASAPPLLLSPLCPCLTVRGEGFPSKTEDSYFPWAIDYTIAWDFSFCTTPPYSDRPHCNSHHNTSGRYIIPLIYACFAQGYV